MHWVPPVESREQLVLFARKIDDALPDNHAVRQLAAIMDQIDWSAWEAEYAQWGPGRTAVHPKVMASVLLYGLLTRIRASRQLEEALTLRIDFRWLAEGRGIDHSTFCIFRRKYKPRLQELFVQLGMLAQTAGILKLSELAFDGTKVRANNRRSGKLKTENLQKLRNELLQKFSEQVAEAEKLDATQASLHDKDSDDSVKGERQSQSLRNIKSRLQQAQRALEEAERLQAAGEAVPQRLPTTDIESRITPNKEGGFAPNYTPAAMTETGLGLIVAPDVIAGSNEKSMLPAAIDAVQEDFGVVPERVLADGIFSHGTNLVELEARGIELYSPVSSQANNPAVREDPQQPVPAEQVERLPKKKTRGQQQFDKSAFVYDAEQDVYYCPTGKSLKYKSTATTKVADGTQVENRRYQASPEDCQACALRSDCITAKQAKFRQVQHDQFEGLRGQLRSRMETPSGQATYARRMAVGERPFAVIKQLFGARQFLTRGLANVKQEWMWLATAFNLKRLMPLLWARAGPPMATAPRPLPDS